MTPLRVIDSGLRPARENLSLTEALSRMRRDQASPNTLRFQHFPPSAIIGRHQRLAREVNLAWTQAHDVELARRMTGGGAIVMGPGMLGWELILAREDVPPGLDAVSALICGAVAAGIASFGIPATYRPRNDIEVHGRKVSGTGGYFDGNVLVFQGTVLIEADLEFMANALNLPTQKLGKRGLSALAERVTDLATLLGTAPSVEAVEAAVAASVGQMLVMQPADGALTPAELDLAQAINRAEIGTDRFVHGLDDAFGAEGRLVSHLTQAGGGSIEVVLKLRDGAAPVVDQALVAGDFFAAPPQAIAGLEAHLRARHVDELAPQAAAYLDQARVRFLGMRPDAVVAAIAAAAQAAR